MTFARLLLLFTIIPLAELYLLRQVAKVIGSGETFLLVIVTGIIGAALARGQGGKVLRAIQADLAEARLPTDHLISGLLVLIGGILLVTPGIVTDLVGLALMIPGNRRLCVPFIKRQFRKRFHVQAFPSPFTPPNAAVREANECRVVDEDAS